MLGIPTVRDRVAQMVVKMQLEPKWEAIFGEDSYGFRPGRSAHQALNITRKRCWAYDWVIEFDIRKLFDCLDHHLLMKAVRCNTQSEWVLLCVERWLVAPLQHADGSLEERKAGVPQGGPISPLLANIFMHYAFDAWMRRTFPALAFCRYADDGLVHCRTKTEAQRVLNDLTARLLECGLEIHPKKTKVVYCKDSNRQGTRHRDIHFTSLGYTFRARANKNRHGKTFTSFYPAISSGAEKAVRSKIRSWRLKSRTSLSLQELACKCRVYIQGWMNYYCRFYKSQFQRLGAYINRKLVDWAMRKFKSLRRRRGKAMRWLLKIAQQDPNLFPHWRAGFTWIG